MTNRMRTRQPLGDRDLELLSAYLDGELNNKERDALETRLGADPVLSAELEALRRTVALVNSLPQLKAPRNFTLNPAEYARPPRVSLLERLGLSRGLVAAGATLAIVAVFVGVFVLSGGFLAGGGGDTAAAEPMVAEMQAQLEEAPAEDSAEAAGLEAPQAELAAEAPAEEMADEEAVSEEEAADAESGALAAQSPAPEATLDEFAAAEPPTPTPSDFGLDGGGVGGAGGGDAPRPAGGGGGPGIGGGADGGDTAPPVEGESVAEGEAATLAAANAQSEVDAAPMTTIEAPPEYLFTPPPQQPIGSLAERKSFFQRSLFSSPLGIALLVVVGLALVGGGVFGIRRWRRRRR